MKSRTSFFNKTIFQKDLTRFAPAWGTCLILMLLALISMADRSFAYYRLQNVRDSITLMSWLNLIYGCIVAQLLFGDLFQSRMCNALHSLPLRRECWFGSHVTAGLLFSFVPNLVLGLLGVALLGLGKGWCVPFLWILASGIQYLFFFSLAVLCMMLVGNRFAQVLVYGIVNVFSLIVYWLVDSLYEPLLHGIRIPGDPFLTWCPVGKMIGSMELVEVVRGHIYNDIGGIEESYIDHIAIGPEWGYMIICALLGIALLALALVLYRKRKLECAGDFIAYRFVEPIFLILYTICAGAFLHLFSEMFGGVDYLFLAIGIAVGFFTGLMLLQRTTRIFRKKAFAQFALFAAVFVLTLVLTWLDPLRITYRVPELNEIASVKLSNSSELTSYQGEGEVELTDPAEIQDMLDIHRDCLKGGEAYVYHADYNVNIRLEYTLTDGSTMNRFYRIDPNCAAGQTAEKYFSSLEAVLGISEAELGTLAENVEIVYFDTKWDSAQTLEDLGIDVEEMLRAIAADCAEGNMAQMYAYHYVPNLDRSNQVTYIEMQLNRSAAELREMGYRYISISIYEEARHTLAWLEKNDLMPKPEPGWG